MKKQCKAIKPDGEKCRGSAAIGDYCMVHYLKLRGIKSKRKTERRQEIK